MENKEALELERAEFDHYLRDIRHIIEDVKRNNQLHRSFRDVKKFVEKFIGKIVDLMREKRYKRGKKYNDVMIDMLYELATCMLIEWIELGEREARKKSWEELVISREVEVKERLLVRVAKYVTAVEELKVEAPENPSWSRWVFLQLAICLNNEACLLHIRGKETDALSKVIRLLEMLDVFEASGVGDLCVRMHTFTNLGYVFRAMEKPVDSLLMFHNACKVCEAVEALADESTVGYAFDRMLRFHSFYEPLPDSISRSIKAADRSKFEVYRNLKNVLEDMDMLAQARHAKKVCDELLNSTKDEEAYRAILRLEDLLEDEVPLGREEVDVLWLLMNRKQPQPPLCDLGRNVIFKCSLSVFEVKMTVTLHDGFAGCIAACLQSNKRFIAGCLVRTKEVLKAYQELDLQRLVADLYLDSNIDIKWNCGEAFRSAQEAAR